MYIIYIYIQCLKSIKSHEIQWFITSLALAVLLELALQLFLGCAKVGRKYCTLRGSRETLMVRYSNPPLMVQ